MCYGVVLKQLGLGILPIVQAPNCKGRIQVLVLLLLLLKELIILLFWCWFIIYDPFCWNVVGYCGFLKVQLCCWALGDGYWDWLLGLACFFMIFWQLLRVFYYCIIGILVYCCGGYLKDYGLMLMIYWYFLVLSACLYRL